MLAACLGPSSPPNSRWAPRAGPRCMRRRRLRRRGAMSRSAPPMKPRAASDILVHAGHSSSPWQRRRHVQAKGRGLRHRFCCATTSSWRVDGAVPLHPTPLQAHRTSCEPIAASPLPVVAVIYFGTHFERLPLLRAAYEPYFQRIVYMSPRAEIASALRPLRAAASTSQSSSATSLAPSSATHRATAHPYHCGLGLKLTYACVADIALTHGASDPGLRGVLFFHFDLWIQPWRLFAPSPAAPEGRGIGAASPTHLARSPLLDRTWALPAGRIMLKAGGSTRLLPIECFNVSSPEQYRLPYPAWTWERDLPPAHAALRKLCGARSSAHGSGGARARRAPSQRCAQPDRLCVGWADLYFVPRGRHARFAELARVFASTGSNAELALPTMLHALNDYSSAAHPADVASPSGSDGGARAAVEAAKQDTLHRPRCWGYCCSSTTCPELLARHACGHRMQLAEPRVRRAFSELMEPS